MTFCKFPVCYKVDNEVLNQSNPFLEPSVLGQFFIHLFRLVAFSKKKHINHTSDLPAVINSYNNPDLATSMDVIFLQG